MEFSVFLLPFIVNDLNFINDVNGKLLTIVKSFIAVNGTVITKLTALTAHFR